MALSLLRVVVSGDKDSAWMAQALECDLVASATTADAAVDTLIKMVEAHVAYDGRYGHHALSRFAAAPQSCWDQFAKAARARAPVEIIRKGYSGEWRYLVATAADKASLN